MRPRWHKILSDLLGHKVRSLLVIASIAVGLFAIGMITTSYVILSEDIRSGYAQVNPANIQVTAAFFDHGFVDHIRNLPDVSEAEGAYNTTLQIRDSAGEWKPVSVKAQAFGERPQAIAIPDVLAGVYPPDDKQIVLDTNRLADVGAQVGDVVEVKLPSGIIRRMPLVGIVQDQTIGSNRSGGGFFLANIQGYVTYDTLAWLEQPERFNTLYVTVSPALEENSALQALAGQILDAFDQVGYMATGSVVRLSGDHPNVPYVDAMAAVIYLLGFLVVFLSGFLITNTFSALLNQQTEQIGVMKTLGASRRQVISLYMVLILVFSLIALAIAIPTSYQAAITMTEYLAERVNFGNLDFHPVPASIILQTIVALLVPQIAGSAPILQGTRISVREALSGAGAARVDNRGFFARMAGRVRGASRPMLISLRNTFRRRGRLVLTLITLTLGGATFIATFNVRYSIENYIDRLGHYFLADTNLTLSQPYRVDRVTRDVMQVPGVASVEGWSGALANVVTAGQKASESVQIIAPPANSTLIEPMLLKGRWLLPQDRNAIVLTELFVESYPDVDVGDTIRLQIGTEASEWQVVGFFQFAGRNSGLMAYTTFDALARETGNYGRAAAFRIVAQGDKQTLDQQEDLARRVEDHLTGLGYEVSEAGAGLALQEKTSEGLDILTTFLLIMSLLLASVGSIGLAGTMSLNVMERTHEIGVMRAIGGSNRAIINIVLVEGVIIGLISWLLACAVALPISKQLVDVMFQIIFDRDAALAFTFSGNAIWLGLVAALSMLASVFPAINASRLTIREVLAYE